MCRLPIIVVEVETTDMLSTSDATVDELDGRTGFPSCCGMTGDDDPVGASLKNEGEPAGRCSSTNWASEALHTANAGLVGAGCDLLTRSVVAGTEVVSVPILVDGSAPKIMPLFHVEKAQMMPLAVRRRSGSSELKKLLHLSLIHI